MPALNSESSGAEIESASEVSCEVAPTRPSKAAQTAPAAGGAAHVTQNYTRLHTLAGAIVVQAAQTAGEFPGTLTQQQGAAIELLLMGKSDRLVAETLGVCRKTVWNWRHANPAFKDEFHRRRKAAVVRHVVEPDASHAGPFARHPRGATQRQPGRQSLPGGPVDIATVQRPAGHSGARGCAKQDSTGQ